VKIVGICSINRDEWLITDLACNLLRISSVALYETLGDELLNMILNQTEMSTIFGSDKALIGILKILRKYHD
jgi:long-chain acyl-CoA synthetase